MSYSDIASRVLAARRLRYTLIVIDFVAVSLTLFALGVGLYMSLTHGLYRFAKAVLTLALPFALVSALRALINAPRPAELCGLDAPGSRRGSSFPSRHVHSAFSIGTVLLFVSAPLGISVLLLGVCLGACRVLLGIHFPRDVIAGALTGSVTALIGMLIL